MARMNKPHDMDDEGDEDRPRKGRKPLDDDHERARNQKKGGGMPVWGWVLLGVCGFVLLGGGLVCAGLFWVGKKTGEALQEQVDKNREQRSLEEAKQSNIKVGEKVSLGPIFLRIRSVSFSHYSGSSPSGQMINSTKPGVVIALETSTSDQTKEHSAKGSTGSASLTDQFGNSISYMRLRTEFGFTCDIQGQLKGGSTYAVRSDKPLTDVLVFDEPVQAASTLTLTLDAANYGGKGKITFKIQDSEWRPQPKNNRKE